MASAPETRTSDRGDIFAFMPRQPEALFDGPPHSRPWDASLAEAINNYQEFIGSDARVTGDEVVIATGQQPALFGGPLYTIYKAITAAKLAQALQEKFGTRCTPLFWLAGDDHDFEEARSVAVLTKDDQPLHLRYEPKETPADTPLHSLTLNGNLDELIERAARETRGSEFRDEIRGFLHDSVRTSNTFCDWTARILARMFQGTSLPVFVPHLPAARRVAAEIVKREIAEPLVSTRLLNEGGARIEAAGLGAQVVKKENECNFFLETEGTRCKVTFDDGRFVVHGAHVQYTIDEMLALLEAEPERFSPNVALRPVVQQRLFPVAAYVAGPGELAYWAQLPGVFEHFGETMPVVYPRLQAVLLTTKHGKLLAKHGLTIADLQHGSEELLDRVLAHSDGSPALNTFREGRDTIMQAVDNLTAQLTQQSKAVASQAPETRSRIAADLERLERTLLHADETRVATIRKQVERLCDVVAPDRKPQERVYSLFSFLFEYGWPLVPRLVDALDPHNRKIQEVEL